MFSPDPLGTMGKRKAEPQKKSYETLSEGIQSAASIPALVYLTRTGEKYHFDAAAFFPEAEDFMLEVMVREDFGAGAGTDSMLYHFEESDLEVAALIANALESVLDSKTEVIVSSIQDRRIAIRILLVGRPEPS